MSTILLIPLMIRGWQWIIIVVLFLLLFGGKKIPEIMRGLGQGIRGFKEGLNDVKDEINRPVDKKAEEKPQEEIKD